ncbi:MAG: hypothetical protein H0W83_00255 [Planctomycetes bacterium]|nr:hypothetical protein [Planctomycetota bacterium]
MRNVVEALIKAADYINYRTEEMDESNDIAALEAIALQLSQMTDQEFKEFETIVRSLKKMDWLQEIMPGRFDGHKSSADP